MSRDQNAGRSHGVKIDNRSIERVEEFKYLAATLTDKNSIQEEIKSRLKLGNACYHSVQGTRPLGRPILRWEDNIKMDLQEVGGGRGDWMELAQDRDGWRALVSTVKNFRIP
jgi:hypothetical protein